MVLKFCPVELPLIIYNKCTVSKLKRKDSRKEKKEACNLLKCKGYEGTCNDYGVKYVPKVSTVGSGMQNKS